MTALRSVFLLGVLALEVWGIPMQITVNQRQSECLYDKLEEGYVVVEASQVSRKLVPHASGLKLFVFAMPIVANTSQ
jgi:hypothetical protein